MDEEEQFVPLDYARSHGLASDHRAVPPLLSSLIPSPPRSSSLQLADPQDIPHLEQLAAFSTREKLFLGREAATMLSICMWNTEHELTREDFSMFAGKRRGKGLRVELPILRTDHELDVRNFGRKVVPGSVIDNIPLEELEELNDEGISWPPASVDLPRQFNEKLRNEKLEVSKNTILYLQSIIRGEDTGDELATIQAEFGFYRGLEPVTPPLLPLPAPAGVFFPSSPGGHLGLLSDHTSPTEVDNRQLTELLMDQDSLVMGQHEVQDREYSLPNMTINSLPEEIVQRSSSQDALGDESLPPLRKRPAAPELVVEGPLTPPSSVPPLSRAMPVSFEEMLQDFSVDTQLESEKGKSSEMEFEEFFKSTIGPMAEDANVRLAQEQLQDAESTLRVDVPPMDFTLNLAPWKVHHSYAGYVNGREGDISQQKCLFRDINSIYEGFRRWPGGGRIDNDLKWAPFPVELGKVVLNEVIQDDCSIGQYLAEIGRMEATDLDSLTWKPEGLQILKDDDGEELDEGELPQGPPCLEQALQRPLGKRGLNTEAVENGTGKRIRASIGKQAKGWVQSPRDRPEVENGSFLGDCSTALETFMRLRGVSSNTEASPLASKSERDIVGRLCTDERPSFPDEIHPMEDLVCKPRLLIMPVLAPHAGPRPFVISSALLSQRRLLRCIRGIYPEAELIERDFTLQRMPVHNPLGGTSGEVIMDSIDEADLIVSPSIGVIWTTMQKIKQRPLPGQKRKPGFREKIVRLSQRYERLIVLVSEGRINNASVEVCWDDSWPVEELDEKDCDALVELIGFAAALSDEIAVMFVGGGEEELAKWIVALMVKYGVAHQELKLLQDETLWEVFLRRAGVNAFAAQVILSELKQREDRVGELGDFGLMGFIKMASQERIERLERSLGGRKLLGRVGVQVDMTGTKY